VAPQRAAIKEEDEMAAVPITFQGMMYPRNKTDAPYPFTALGVASITGLGVGGGPILPPDEVPPVEPPLHIWGGPFDPPHAEHPIVLPPDLPPIDPPSESTHPVKKNAWNWNDGTNPQYPNTGWFYVYVPGEGEAGPKRAGAAQRK
jgi:hypothetical protein